VRTDDSHDPAFGRVRRANSKRQRKQYDDQDTFAKRDRHVKRLATVETAADETDGLPEGDRWSTWDQSVPTERGPKPHPEWLVTELAAVDTELGILKTGKEADVFLLRRGTSVDHSCLLAAKRYRDAAHRLFHRDAGYLEGRRTRDTRVSRAAASRTAFGKQAIAGQWANAEFAALCRLYSAGVPVPYPVQILGTEVLLEFIGEPDGTAAPRLAETRPDEGELASLWDQLTGALCALARHGLAHGDLSAYNLLVHRGRLVIIDLPQVVDVISHPNGLGFLTRDAANIATWFAKAGHPEADPGALGRLLAEEAGLVLAASAKLRP
jgi:RIO kinase 1